MGGFNGLAGNRQAAAVYGAFLYSAVFVIHGSGAVLFWV
jgi:hypothetical protein